MSIYPCPGRNRVSDNRKWYIPLGKTSSECTYCQECYETFVKGTPKDEGFVCQSGLYQCNCDYPKDYTNKCLEKDNFRVILTDTKTGKVFELIPNTLANLNGVAQFVLPTCSNYSITIDNLDGATYSWFSFVSGRVGDKDIVINNGQTIYHKNSLEIRGFKTGTNDSFLFYSPSNKEKWEGKTLEGENVTNVINLKLRRYTRISNPEVYLSKGFSTRGGDGHYLNYGMIPGTYECSLQCSSSSRNESYSGGATLSGGSNVDHIRTTTTKDTFNPQGSVVEFVIQLICNQSDDEKYNANQAYNMKVDYEKRQVLLNKKERLLSDLKHYEDKITNLKADIDSTNQELDKYAYLGSTNKNDYLMQFSI
ncbi:hypothetical protein QKU48_gp0132 [Fadolivirus algeromassiliense]|jgi:hypothetical protein|uniref:Uncharacterized protein n=1 Tax=Fadolivirus FV1/VV64 TaxID=3070911 RepID=A0A7D3USI7_9VIRU|nr:hypothetical protein QKU48_gp0132 [Fadolivirus algeromassiliense]QKF93590.1 hypothetical protein Fadolivirus_1_132 [Fadolivirus FV1/VV64]